MNAVSIIITGWFVIGFISIIPVAKWVDRRINGKVHKSRRKSRYTPEQILNILEHHGIDT